MRFDAHHVSFSAIEGGWVLALADSADGTGPTHIMLSFGNEDDQCRALGLTGLFIASSWSQVRGYGFVEKIEFDGQTITVLGRAGYEDVHIQLATAIMSREAVAGIVERCNNANATRPEKAV